MSLDFLGDDASPGASVFVPEPGTIFLDHTFAKQAGLSTGDTLSFNDRSFEVTDVRSIGNVLVTQFAFVSPQDYPGSPFRFCVFGFGMVRNGVRVRPQLRSTLGAANTRWGGSAARPGSEAPETESQRSLIPSPFLSSWSGLSALGQLSQSSGHASPSLSGALDTPLLYGQLSQPPPRPSPSGSAWNGFVAVGQLSQESP